MILHTPAAIDISALPPPLILEQLSHASFVTTAKQRYVENWAAARLKDPSLPLLTIEELTETETPVIIFETASDATLRYRQRVNDALKAMLIAYSRKSNLDHLLANRNMTRLVITPAANGRPAVMESDESAIQRYLLDFDKPSAGSEGGYLARAKEAWPNLYDAAVLNYVVHGRRGDIDVVIAGPNGDMPTTGDLSAVRDAVNARNAKQAATAVNVMAARRVLYQVSQVLEIGRGPDAEAVRDASEARVIAATQERTSIGVLAPAERFVGAAYDRNIIRVIQSEPAVDVVASPYEIPVCSGLNIKPRIIA